MIVAAGFEPTRGFLLPHRALYSVLLRVADPVISSMRQSDTAQRLPFRHATNKSYTDSASSLCSWSAATR